MPPSVKSSNISVLRRVMGWGTLLGLRVRVGLRQVFGAVSPRTSPPESSDLTIAYLLFRVKTSTVFWKTQIVEIGLLTSHSVTVNMSY